MVYWERDKDGFMGDFAIRFADKTGDERSDDEISKMVAEIADVIAKYGYAPRQYGKWEDMRRGAVQEQAFVDDFLAKHGEGRD